MQKNKKDIQEQMEEKGRNVVRQLCFHMDSTPIYPK